MKLQFAHLQLTKNRIGFSKIQIYWIIQYLRRQRMKTSKEQLNKDIGKNKVRYNAKTEGCETVMLDIDSLSNAIFCDIQGDFLL